MSKISFVMPTRDRGETISTSIDSIMSQTEKDWELVLVDNNSEDLDKTEEVVKKYDDNRIKYVKTPKDFIKGIAEARNFANVLANSDVVAIADSDDINMPKRAEITLRAFKNGCDVFYSDCDIMDSQSGGIKKRLNHPVVDLSQEILSKYNPVPHGTLAMKRSVALNFPYNSYFQLCEDYDLITRLFVEGKKFHFYNGVLFRYMIHPGNISIGVNKEAKMKYFEDAVRFSRGWLENFNSGNLLDL